MLIPLFCDLKNISYAWVKNLQFNNKISVFVEGGLTESITPLQAGVPAYLSTVLLFSL